MKSPAQWQPTDVKPPESDLRPTSERKEAEKERNKDREGWSLQISESHFKQLSTIHFMQVCTDEKMGFFLYMLQWLSNMQLVGHRNQKQANVYLY